MFDFQASTVQDQEEPPQNPGGHIAPGSAAHRQCSPAARASAMATTAPAERKVPLGTPEVLPIAFWPHPRRPRMIGFPLLSAPNPTALILIPMLTLASMKRWSRSGWWVSICFLFDLFGVSLILFDEMVSGSCEDGNISSCDHASPGLDCRQGSCCSSFSFLFNFLGV